jgi:hypothetical protein
MTSSPNRSLAEVLRDEMVMQARIAEELTKGSLTIPELAERLGAPSWEVTVWVMSMRRYGKLEELPKSRADDYYAYGLAKRGGPR